MIIYEYTIHESYHMYTYIIYTVYIYICIIVASVHHSPKDHYPRSLSGLGLRNSQPQRPDALHTWDKDETPLQDLLKGSPM